MKRALIITVVLAAIFLGWSNAGYAQCDFGNYDFDECFRESVSYGNPFQATTLLDVLQNIGGFLIVAAGILAGIVIIASGLVYMSAGNNTARVGTAKAMFKNGVIGALILFMAGVIINTIIGIAIDPTGFFS